MVDDWDRIALIHALTELAGHRISDVEVDSVLEHYGQLPATGSLACSVDLYGSDQVRWPPLSSIVD